MNGTMRSPRELPMVTALARHQSLVSQTSLCAWPIPLTNASAEFKGPGVRRQYEDDGDDFEMDMDQRTRGIGSGRSGRIILLGDGTEVLTDSDEHEMMEHDDDVHLEGQTRPGDEGHRNAREDTPGPESVKDSEHSKPGSQSTSSNTSIDKNETKIKAAADPPSKEAAE